MEQVGGRKVARIDPDPSVIVTSMDHSILNVRAATRNASADRESEVDSAIVVIQTSGASIKYPKGIPDV